MSRIEIPTAAAEPISRLAAAPDHPPPATGTRSAPAPAKRGGGRAPQPRPQQPAPMQIMGPLTEVYERLRRMVLREDGRGVFRISADGMHLNVPDNLDSWEASVRALPSPAAYRTLAADLGAALAEKPDRRKTRQVAAAFLSAFTTTKAADPGYVDWVISEIDATCDDRRAGPQILAPALRGLVRTSTFLPSVHEIVAAVEPVQKQFVRGRKLAPQMADLVERELRFFDGGDDEPPF